MPSRSFLSRENFIIRFSGAAVAALLLTSTALAKPKPSPTAPSRDDVVRLQIYLDEQNFSPGKIDGRFGGFTVKSWQRYQQSQGMPLDNTFNAKAAPFTAITPIYITYTVNKDDLASIGTMPTQLAEQAKNKVLPYTSMPEMIGERYHVGVDFLRQLNVLKNLDELREGDTVKVPNVVPPFNLAQVIALKAYTAERAKVIKAGKEAASRDRTNASAPEPSPPEEMPGPTVAVSASPPPADAVPSPTVPPAGNPPSATPAVPDASPAAIAADNRPVLPAVPADSSRLVFHISTKDDYLEVRDGDRLVACFPITPGSTSIPDAEGRVARGRENAFARVSLGQIGAHDRKAQ